MESRSQINVIKKRNVLGKNWLNAVVIQMTVGSEMVVVETDPRDLGKHVICAEMTTGFLSFLSQKVMT